MPPGSPQPSGQFQVACCWRTDRPCMVAANRESGPVHRLNRAEYNNAIRDLFSLDIDVIAAGRRDRGRQFRQLRRPPPASTFVSAIGSPQVTLAGSAWFLSSREARRHCSLMSYGRPSERRSAARSRGASPFDTTPVDAITGVRRQRQYQITSGNGLASNSRFAPTEGC
jgi:hypothetical protein